MRKEILFTVLLAVLVTVSAVQAIQLADINSQIEGISITAAATSTKTTTSSSSSSSSTSTGSGTSLPSSLQNLPNMVGGC